jgi:CheY-like chemotaxis protein
MPGHVHGCQKVKAEGSMQARLLIADDNPINQKVAVRLVVKLDYKVDVVENGVQAIDALLRLTYQTILMDCQMPEMDGLEATRRIRELERGGKLAAHIRIIAITANVLPEHLEECLLAGMDDYLTLPIKIEQLKLALGKCQP